MQVLSLKHNTDISIINIWQKEQETQLGLWASNLLHWMINHEKEQATYPPYKEFRFSGIIDNGIYFYVMGNISNYNTRSTQKKPGSTAKCIVRHKKAWFDTKMPGSTQKCPPQHAPVNIAIIKHPPPPPFLWQIFFQILFQCIVSKNQ